MSWVVREYGNAQSIPTAVLLSYLRQELQVQLCAALQTICWTCFGSGCRLRFAAGC